jgi:hypothetical protein
MNSNTNVVYIHVCHVSCSVVVMFTCTLVRSHPDSRGCCMRILLITIFEISIYIDIWYFLYVGAPHFNIPFVFLNTWGSSSQYSKISHYVFIEILKFEVNITSRYKKYPSVCIPKYSPVRTTVYMFSTQYLNISLAKKKTTISDSNTWDGSYIYYWLFL